MDIQKIKKEFEEKFVKKVIKQVDTSNSIELPLWKDNHSHLSVDVWQFIESSLTKAYDEGYKDGSEWQMKMRIQDQKESNH